MIAAQEWAAFFIMPDLKIDGLDELNKLIDKFPELALEAAREAMNAALLLLHGRLPEYPPPPGPGAPSPLHTAKQRRWFFAALREERIQVPYRRTGTLGRRFAEAVSVDEAGVTGQIGTNLPYAPWVVGPDYPGQQILGQTMYQARIHQGRWWQFETVVQENLGDAFEEFEEVFFEEFGTRIAREV